MGGNSPCASCKLLRRRCAKDCIFAPYFPSDDPHKFAIVHKVFGASNVSKMLQNQVSELQMQLAVAQAEILCIQMQHQVQDPMLQQLPNPSPTTAHGGATASQLLDDQLHYDKPFLLHNHHQFINSTTNVIHDQYSVKRETIFGDMVS
ncbi:LOB domain-containing protein 12-like [Gossypium australe]|uniref:LOB domain-containing protein 12-like n=1 Tax=Gossypium australe TaxID=47621 RepID=A0A5B6W914_9ROSI|nr:LOB domain-containing protein 12-like [Gossypium australe]